MGPVMGWAFDRLLFRHIANSNSTAKMVCSLALLVGIPVAAPGHLRAAEPRRHRDDPARSSTPTSCTSPLSGTPINGIYLSTISVTVVVLVLLTILLRYTSLGLQMRAAVESRRLVQLDGVNANGVVAVAWVVSSFMASLAGVLLAPVFGAFNSEDYVTLTVTAIAAAAWALLRSMPIAAGVGVLIGVLDHGAAGVHPAEQLLQRGGRAVAAVLRSWWPRCSSSRACAAWTPSRDPLATIDPPPPPIAATTRAPSMDRIIRVLWWVLFAAFCVSMLTWMPIAWATVFNNGLTLLDRAALDHADHGHGGSALAVPGHPGRGRRLHGGPAGQPPRPQPAGRADSSARRWPRPSPSCWPCCRCGCEGLGLALMTLAAALLFDATFFNETSITGGGQGVSIQAKWLGTQRLLQFQRSCHVPPVARASSSWRSWSSSWCARGRWAGTWRPCGGARRRRRVSA